MSDPDERRAEQARAKRISRQANAAVERLNFSDSQSNESSDSSSRPSNSVSNVSDLGGIDDFNAVEDNVDDRSASAMSTASSMEIENFDEIDGSEYSFNSDQRPESSSDSDDSENDSYFSEAISDEDDSDHADPLPNIQLASTRQKLASWVVTEKVPQAKVDSLLNFCLVILE